MTVTTLYHAICNGYDKPVRMPSLCEHVDYTVIAGTTCRDRGAVWNRYHKWMGAPILTDFVVYMDGNISPAVPSEAIHTWVENTLQNADMAICKHAARKCAYVEIEACVARGKINDRQARTAHEYLHQHKLPKNFGLWECGIIVRRMNKATWVEDIGLKVFGHITETGIARDQLWLPLVLHEMQERIPAGRFKTIDMDVRKNPVFTFRAHA